MPKKNAGANSWQDAMLALGVSVCLVGALLMGWGGPILGENHAGVATVMGIVGIGIITKAKKGKSMTNSLRLFPVGGIAGMFGNEEGGMN